MFCDIYMHGRLTDGVMAQYRLQIKMLTAAKRNVTIDMRGVEQLGQTFWPAVSEWVRDIARYGGKLAFLNVPSEFQSQFAERGSSDLILE